VAEHYAKAVAEAARHHRRAVARLVDEMRVAETLADAERIKADLTTSQDHYEAVLMKETIALQARNDRLVARLRQLQRRPRPRQNP
jgi:hypothetical protein